MAKSIAELLDEMKVIHNQMEGLKLLFDTKKTRLQKYFDKTGEKKVNSEEVTAYVQSRVDVKYDIDAIKEQLDKDTYSLFITRTYSIPDPKAFRKICKALGVDFKDFKSALKVTESIDQKALDKLYNDGLITIKDLEGCYEADAKKSLVVKFKNVNNEIPLDRKDELK